MWQRKLRCFLLPLFVLVGMGVFALPAFAEENVYAVQVGEHYYQAAADGTKASDVTVAKETITHLFADASVSQVGRKDEIFAGCGNLQVVDLSKATALNTIYSEAFRDCTNLHTVLLPANLREIQSGAFRGCTALTAIDLSHTGLTTIAPYLFYGCTGLQSVSFPAGLTAVDYYAFCYCTVYPLGDALQATALRSVANHAFYGCVGITNVVLPDSTASLGVNSFGQCANFATLHLGATPPTASLSTFTGCAQTNLLGVDAAVIPTYKAVGDSDATDLYWYGWLLEKYDVTAQLSLAVTDWKYCADGAPAPVLQKNGATIASDVTYLYATAEDGVYQAIDKLPHSNAGEIAVGSYWCKAMYDAQSEDGTAVASFAVTQKEITATIWVGGITKEYDGNTEVKGLQPTVKMVGGLAGDEVSATGDFSYESATIGESKKILAENLALTGADKGNYILKSTIASEVGAVITKAKITIPDPTASAIDYGETLAQSILTPTGLPIPGHWEWVDDTTQPAKSGLFPAIFIPDDTVHYQVYGPVDVYVEVIPKSITVGGAGDDPIIGDGNVVEAPDSSSQNESAQFNTPETGDATHLARYIVLAAIAFLGFVVSLICILWGRREMREEAQDVAAPRARMRYVSKH